MGEVNSSEQEASDSSQRAFWLMWERHWASAVWFGWAAAADGLLGQQSTSSTEADTCQYVNILMLTQADGCRESKAHTYTQVRCWGDTWPLLERIPRTPNVFDLGGRRNSAFERPLSASVILYTSVTSIERSGEAWSIIGHLPGPCPALWVRFAGTPRLTKESLAILRGWV